MLIEEKSSILLNNVINKRKDVSIAVMIWIPTEFVFCSKGLKQ